MKIVVNALQYKPNSSGIGVMIRELFGRFSEMTGQKCQVFLSRDTPDFPAGEDTELIYSPYDYSQGLGRMFFQSFQLGRYCRDAALLTTDSKVPLFLPKSCRLAPLVTDLAVYRLPEVYDRSRVLWWRLQYKSVCRRAALFLAISEFTKRELTEILNIPPERIFVVPMACSEGLNRVEDADALAAVGKRYELPEKYVLFVGNNNPRKNLERTIQAFDRMKERSGLPHQLIIAGEQGWKFDRERALEGVGHRAEVRFIGFVPDEDMPALYSGAELFVFPTLYEGFGIPVLEAQRCGVPVVTSNVSALPETAGAGAEYADPYDAESIADAMRRVLEDKNLAAGLVEKGYENEKRFSWERSAEKLARILKEELAP